jgi:hypothetical protein
MTAFACAFAIRSGFTLFDGLAALIAVFRGRFGFAFATARTFASQGFDTPVTRPHRPLGYMLHRHFTW